MELNKCSIKILESVLWFIELLIKFLLFKGGVLIYAEHCMSVRGRCVVCFLTKLSSLSCQVQTDLTHSNLVTLTKMRPERLICKQNMKPLVDVTVHALN